ncbi:MAG: fumarylacetoacetate hydrolase family protein [Phenylobacterium sp.]|uniref:fumarylacetoacetate hydrolase family protein n=1 Tax=Phenylobacterium sp. TaxID=1871053 RepID=UPI00273263A6|nr:fumarylacetoacetate hydrolase family protein [Phenylobacterium sp.]MDP3174653.1 fumarylacetoacetate hydrolase family protein [Phenylobacterium sp.]
MDAYIFPPPPITAVPVLGESSTFPVRRVICVGRNYAAHVREMGADERDPPFFFAKPADAVVSADAVAYPQATSDLHHEIELVAALSGGGVDLTPGQALDLVYGYAVGVDLTRRDLQNEAKAQARPWDSSKGFDASGPISWIRPWMGPPPQGRISLSVNGEVRQDGRVADMIWNVAEVIAEASRLWRLEPGDLIFTGTPEGVGPVSRGDRVSGEVEGVGALAFTLI